MINYKTPKKFKSLIFKLFGNSSHGLHVATFKKFMLMYRLDQDWVEYPGELETGLDEKMDLEEESPVKIEHPFKAEAIKIVIKKDWMTHSRYVSGRVGSIVEDADLNEK